MPSEKRLQLLRAIQTGIADAQGQGAIYGNAVATQLGLSPTELETLGVVDMRGSLTAGEIAQRTGLTTGAVTRMIDRLISGGWVTRREDPSDRRRVLVELTATARRRSAPYYEPIAKATADVLGMYTEKELELFLEVVTRLREAGIAQMGGVLGIRARRKTYMGR